MICSVVGDYINTMKTTCGLNFDLNKVVKQHMDTYNYQSKNLLFDYLKTCNSEKAC